jgi:replicative DNA helicase
MFVYREEHYLERNGGADPAARNVAAGKAEIMVAKRHHGPTGVANLRFDGATTRFSMIRHGDGRRRREGLRCPDGAL